jgi:hypothetical protein
MGLPTEKERERHVNDRHSKNPVFYKCDFCEFRTKRESNCKQHQEKKHGWNYERAKGKDKAASSKMTPAQTPRTPSMDYSPSPAVSVRTWDDASSIAGSMPGSNAMTPFEQPLNSFDTFNPTPVTYSNPIFPRTSSASTAPYNHIGEDFDFNSAPFQNHYQPAHYPNLMTTPITPAYSNITEPSPYSANMDITMDCNNQTSWNQGLPTPSSYFQPNSRNPSISEHSPMVAGPSGQSFGDAPLFGSDPDFPSSDFSLFGGESSSAFSNPAAATATLFPGGPEAFATLDNDPMFDPAWNDSDFIDYDMSN